MLICTVLPVKDANSTEGKSSITEMLESRNDDILFQPHYAISLYQHATLVFHVSDCVHTTCDYVMLQINTFMLHVDTYYSHVHIHSSHVTCKFIVKGKRNERKEHG